MRGIPMPGFDLGGLEPGVATAATRIEGGRTDTMNADERSRTGS